MIEIYVRVWHGGQTSHCLTFSSLVKMNEIFEKAGVTKFEIVEIREAIEDPDAAFPKEIYIIENNKLRII